MFYVIYILAGLAGGILTGMAELTAAMVLTLILCGVCGWVGYDATTLALIVYVPSAMAPSWTFYKNGNMDIKRGMPADSEDASVSESDCSKAVPAMENVSAKLCHIHLHRFGEYSA